MKSKSDQFNKDGQRHFITIKRTGNVIPQPARVTISKEYWEAVGGVEGWETTKIYDRTFEDWNYAYAVYDEILKRAMEGDKQCGKT